MDLRTTVYRKTEFTTTPAYLQRCGYQVDNDSFAGLAGFSVGRHLSAFFAGFGEPDGDGLFAALYAAAFASFAGA